MVARLLHGVVLFGCVGALSAQDVAHRSFRILCFVKTTRGGAGFPVIAANKDWASGEVVDETSNHAFGASRTSGKLSGWALALQPNGAWTFNLGDGKNRLDYRPTAERQRINDGRVHLIGFALDRSRNECRLYFDGRNVAIYSIRGLGAVGGDGQQRQSADVEAFQFSAGTTTDAAVARVWGKRTGQKALAAVAATPVESLRVLAWNIWHGGRRDGAAIGLKKTIDVIRKSRADVICMQETYGSGAVIADALGYYFYLRSTNLSVMSRLPMRRTLDLYQPFRLGGVEIEVAPGRVVKVFSLWINHLPSIGKQMAQPTITAEQLVAADDATRGREIRGILAALKPHLDTADQMPVIVAGDFNSPSHLDWTGESTARHRGLRVAWPVSSAMVQAGFSDAYRVVHPDPSQQVGRTWSPRFVDSYQNRIDYVYYKGRGVRATGAAMLDEHPQGWPSDHAAVLTTLRLPKRGGTAQPRRRRTP